MPPRGVKSARRKRQYEHIKDSEKKRGRSTKRAKEIAAATVNKQRREAGQTKSAGGRKKTSGRSTTSGSRKKTTSGGRKKTSSRRRTSGGAKKK